MGNTFDDMLGGLRARVQDKVAENARRLRGLVDPEAPLAVRAKRPWDIPAKMEVARKIMAEEIGLGGTHHNDKGDAIRHARASQRLTEATGPIFAEVAGAGHELVNVGRYLYEDHERSDYRPQPAEQLIDEIKMDLHNNAEGRRAALEGRAIDEGHLQKYPAPAPYTALYRDPPDHRISSARR